MNRDDYADPLCRSLHPQPHAWSCSGHVDLNLVPDSLVERFAPPGKRQTDEGRVLLALSGEGRSASSLGKWQVPLNRAGDQQIALAR